jgi:hypothetical protein
VQQSQRLASAEPATPPGGMTPTGLPWI